jgi:tRNA(Ile)-lysidine synthase
MHAMTRADVDLSPGARAWFHGPAMARTLLDGIRDAIRRHGLLAAGDMVLVAVSGGADSVALLVALHELRGALGIRLAAAHLDHGLRGEEGANDRRFVEALATRLGVTLHSERVTLPAGNLEATARRARYAFLERTATELTATRIATAHTLDDQAETLLLRLFRGAGRRGLGGIRPRRGRIVRPLLLCDRVQVRYFLADRGLEWRQDRMNFDFGFARTRVRAGYLPALRREFNPRLPQALARLADVLRDEDLLLDRLASTAVGRRVVLDLAVLRVLEPALARRALRCWWRRQGSGRRLGLAHVEAALSLVRRDGGDGEVRVPGGTIERVGTKLAFRAVADAEPPIGPYEIRLVPGAVVETPGGWRLRLSETLATDAPAAGDAVCLLDADRVPATFTVRNRRSGDRMRLLGLTGHTTIKRLLIARRVPRGRRAAYPLLLAGEEVLWVPGCGRSDRAPITADTRRVWVIRVEHEPAAYDRESRMPKP